MSIELTAILMLNRHDVNAASLARRWADRSRAEANFWTLVSQEIARRAPVPQPA